MEPASYNSERQGSGQGGQWVFGTDKFTDEDNARIQKVSQGCNCPFCFLNMVSAPLTLHIMFPVCSILAGSLSLSLSVSICPSEVCTPRVAAFE